MSPDIWIGAILGAIVIPGILKIVQYVINLLRDSLPKRRLLEGIADNKELCRIFVRDLILEQNASVISIDPLLRTTGRVPNVTDLWPHVEALGTSYIYNILGQVDKVNNIEVLPMSRDHGEWDSHIIVFGAQANKSFEFYRNMEHVAYRVDSENIYDNQTNEIIERENGYGYGIILKAINPFNRSGHKRGIAILIGGFGVLGTEAASYYFHHKFKKLGQDFGKHCFGIVIRASISSGAQSVERLTQYDREFNS